MSKAKPNTLMEYLFALTSIVGAPVWMYYMLENGIDPGQELAMVFVVVVVARWLPFWIAKIILILSRRY
ncbi:hypothetical protein FACS1894116_11010 [Betaproteobacteria bacterium]|nr:hypothetical protein FACS1894116_11010 [Betaproteobacteria bacterium]GHT99292.1 hypothetical protein FACS1894154_06130 [Betaproteobacteria bacterium]GHU25247.1 hypothetical protein FACS189488_11800 [Betaproteobacteria bacterium]GHU32016.1 hypothetical protein FACS189497_13320 [Betaproteobacteria bacterium]